MKIRGSQAYKRKMYCDLMAMITSVGPPTLFLTVSANDLKWDDLCHLLHRRVRYHYDKRSLETIQIVERNKILTVNPVLCGVRYYMDRLRAFLQLVLLNPMCSHSAMLIFNSNSIPVTRFFTCKSALMG